MERMSYLDLIVYIFLWGAVLCLREMELFLLLLGHTVCIIADLILQMLLGTHRSDMRICVSSTQGEHSI